MAARNLSLASEVPDFSSLLTILLGKEERRYVVHKDFIYSESQFVRDSWKPDFKFGNSQIIGFRDVEDFESMQILVNWCYKKKTALLHPVVDPRKDGDAANNIRRMQLMKTYLLAREFVMPNLMNDITDQFRKHSDSRPMAASLIKHMVESNMEMHGLTRYIIDDFGYFLAKNPKTYQDSKSLWAKHVKPLLEKNAPLLGLAFSAQMRFSAGEAPPKRNPLCFYHDHAEGEEPCSGAEGDLLSLDGMSSQDEDDESDGDFDPSDECEDGGESLEDHSSSEMSVEEADDEEEEEEEEETVAELEAAKPIHGHSPLQNSHRPHNQRKQ